MPLTVPGAVVSEPNRNPLSRGPGRAASGRSRRFVAIPVAVPDQYHRTMSVHGLQADASIRMGRSCSSGGPTLSDPTFLIVGMRRNDSDGVVVDPGSGGALVRCDLERQLSDVVLAEGQV